MICKNCNAPIDTDYEENTDGVCEACIEGAESNIEKITQLKGELRKEYNLE